MVVAEAQAMGVPVLTSRLVGASECLPGEYAPWLLDAPEPEPLAARALALLADAELRGRLVDSGRGIGRAFDDRAYADGNAAADRRSEPPAQVDGDTRTGRRSCRALPPCGSLGSKLSRASLSP